MSFKPAHSFSHISAIQLQLIKHQRILKIILAASPKQLQAHIKDCVINDNNLMIYVSSAAWASQLRFCSVQIQQAVNSGSNERIKRLESECYDQSHSRCQRKQQKYFPRRRI